MKLISLLSLFLLPSLASAHTRWFADDSVNVTYPAEPTSYYLLIAAILVTVITSVGVYLHQRNLLRLAFLRPSNPQAYERAASTFTMVVGSFLIIAGTHEYLFSPNLTVESGIPMYLVATQILIGLGFLLGIATRTLALFLVVLWASVFFFADWLFVVENIWILTSAIFIAIMGNDYFSLISFSIWRRMFAPFKKYALSILRIGVGATLMVLALSEKIMSPELGVHFLKLHDWNFMQMAGLQYSDYLFVLSAGVTEFLFGLIFLLGIVTRLNAVVVAIVFTIPLFILGPIELAGHIPHFAAIVLLVIFGSGGKFMFFKKYKDVQVGS